MSEIQVSLIGQPNAGKSSLFSRLTGIGVISSNYPGTTVEFEESTVIQGDVTLNIHDLPGTYSLYANSADEDVVVDMLRDEKNDVIVVVADSTNMESSLVFTIEVMELGVPTVLALNKYDLASKRFDLNCERLEKILGIPVVTVSSKTGEGVKELLDVIAEGSARISDYKVLYDGHILEYIDELTGMDRSLGWGSAVKMLEGLRLFADSGNETVRKRIPEMRKDFVEHHGESLDVHMARDRYGDAHIIVKEVAKPKGTKLSRKEVFSEVTIMPSTGIPILLFVLLMTFGCLIFVGGLLAEAVDAAYASFVGTALSDFGREVGGDLGEAMMTGVDSSLSAILGLVIPYIMVFYVVLGVLEDSGYLPRAVVLLDRVMHRIGLHGNGFIPMMVGLGCNVPAILSTRVIKSKRERVILSSVICIAVPCSAQLAIITGVTGKYAGIIWVFVIFTVLIALGLLSGHVLNKRMKYEPSNLAMELPELQYPGIKNVLSKTWIRTSDFFKLAVPLLIVGSIIIEIMVQFNYLDVLIGPMSWLTMGMLGLPAVTIVAFIAGILRKEMSYGMLVILAASQGISDIALFMTPQQFIVFGVVMSIYIPCLATMTAIYRELGARNTLYITAATMTVAVFIGTVFNGILSTVM